MWYQIIAAGRRRKLKGAKELILHVTDNYRIMQWQNCKRILMSTVQWNFYNDRDVL